MNLNYSEETYREAAERAVENSSYQYTDAAFEKLFLNAYFGLRDELDDVEYESADEYNMILEAYMGEIYNFESLLTLVSLKK